MEVIITTHNGHKHLASIVKTLNRITEVSKTHVVDNAYDDFSREEIKNVCAQNKKCKYYFCEQLGKGNAIRTALKHIKNDVFFVDASIENFSEGIAKSLIAKFNQGFGFVKANFYSAALKNNYFTCRKLLLTYAIDFNLWKGRAVSEHAQEPHALKYASHYHFKPPCFSRWFLTFKELNQFSCLKINNSNNAIYCIRKDVLDRINVPESMHVDFNILLQACKLGCSIIETDIGKSINKLEGLK